MADARLTAGARAEQVARASYGRLLAILAAETGDIPRAEDALAGAFERALTTWPQVGIPSNPEAWLVTVARNRHRDVVKSSAYRTSAPLDVEPGVLDLVDVEAIPDKRLELMFVCAHPAIDAAIRTPLMLHTVLGFDAAYIARAFAVPATTMAQRLVRAKRRIRSARVPFVVPVLQDMPARLPSVLEAVYGAYAIDWQLVSGPTVRDSLAAEALYLATTLAKLLDDEPEAFALAALIAFSLARVDARVADDGCLVPLATQNRALWRPELVREGERLLHRAHALGRISRFQLEAAIQSAHCAPGEPDAVALLALHDALVRVSPTLGARVARAAVLADVGGARAGLTALDDIDGAERFQPAWATRAHLHATLGVTDAAASAYSKAISLTTDGPSRLYLERRAAEVRPADR
ncbi:RNA polymerase sigma factor [Conyzicola sp.]|uniref:RNA polymerase sigma factor n=1 Tax=Conyzicola sp. TaxID=1969404 RepID=UPI0039896026